MRAAATDRTTSTASNQMTRSLPNRVKRHSAPALLGAAWTRERSPSRVVVVLAVQPVPRVAGLLVERAASALPVHVRKLRPDLVHTGCVASGRPRVCHLFAPIGSPGDREDHTEVPVRVPGGNHSPADEWSVSGLSDREGAGQRQVTPVDGIRRAYDCCRRPLFGYVCHASPRLCVVRDSP